MNQPEIIFENMLKCRVCSPLSWDETKDWLNMAHSSGTQNGWQKDDLPQSAPIDCDDGKGTHYMFVC